MAYLLDRDGKGKKLEQRLMTFFLYIAQSELKDVIAFPENTGTLGTFADPVVIIDPVNNYNNVVPSYYTFDLSMGYDTGDTPSNTYLKNIGIQFIIQNLMGIHPAFQYGPSNQGRTFAAYDILKGNQGRTFGVTLTKTW